MSGKRSSKQEASGRGRHRGEFLDAQAQAQQQAAKGHSRPDKGKPGLKEQPDPQAAQQERGHQKGFGRNQQEEGESRHTKFGTRAWGAEHG